MLSKKTEFGNEDRNHEDEVAKRLDRIRHAADDKVRENSHHTIISLMPPPLP